ncbi:MAG: hypothetical protein RIR53_155 [Bacteroidota bacterium]|jgi:hypothetical protein
MPNTLRLVTRIIVVFMATASVLAQAPTPRDYGLGLNARITSGSKPSITLRWSKDDNQQAVYIWKKLKDASRFEVEVNDSVVGTGQEWTDMDVLPGESYEYRVFRLVRRGSGSAAVSFYATGYINAGIDAPPAPRERVLVLVDSTMRQPLTSQLATFTQDLVNEGWDVTTLSVPRAETFDSGKVNRVRALIKQEWNTGRDLGAIVLVGRVPVPYSGVIAPDGHTPDHLGAWPADGIYGDHNGVYTDRSSNQPNTSRVSNNNVPGDGKFDQSLFNTDIDIPVGRIDFYNMPQFSKSETDLLKNYFTKNHEYRSGQWTVRSGGIIDDNFGTYGEVFAASAWRTFSVFGNDTSVKAGDFFTDLKGPTTYLLGYGCGAGTDVSAGGVGSTTDMSTKPVHAVFTFLFGSYFGDWDTRNNFLRAALATDPRVLTCAWSGRPHWYIHHMALGETIGYSARLSQNNQVIVGGNQLGNYVPNASFSANGLSIAAAGDRQIHIALMGDPTLRSIAKPVSALGTLTAKTEFPNKVNLTWLKPSGGADAYMVYRRKDGVKKWTLLTPQPIGATSYKDSLKNDGTIEYMVRCCALRSSASGTYYDMGRGVTASVLTTDVAEDSDVASQIAATVSPNPASENVDVTFTLGTPGVTTVELVDVTGRSVSTFEAGVLAAGEHRTSFDVSTLPVGAYTVRLKGASQTLSTNVLVVR